MSLADAELQDAPGQQLAVTWNPARADKLLAGSGHTFADLLALADAGQPVPAFALPARLKATTAAERTTSNRRTSSASCADPIRCVKDEYVVFSAHLDHLGIGGAVNGDAIYNGAMDNASGVAAMLDVAAMLHEQGARPRRSILFVAVTGEEKGQLGSRYLRRASHRSPRPIVANVNTDMFLPLFPLKTLMVLGLDESDLGTDIRAAAKVAGHGRAGRSRTDSAIVFIRSDQYSFVKAGIPALAMKVGYDEGTPEAEIARKWTAERYHAPSDDLDQPIDRTAAGKYVDVIENLAVRIANRTDRPEVERLELLQAVCRGWNPLTGPAELEHFRFCVV